MMQAQGPHRRFLSNTLVLIPLMLLLCWGGCKDDPVQSPGTVIGPAGGTVIGPSGATLTIPAGALSKEETFTIIADAKIPPPPGYTVIGLPRSIDPAGTTFSKLATLVIPYDKGKLGGLSEKELSIYTTEYNPRGWARVVSQVSGGKATGQITHLSFLALAAPGKVLRTKGQPCTHIQDCRIGLRCVDGKCGDCKQIGTCTGDLECCSNYCKDNNYCIACIKPGGGCGGGWFHCCDHYRCIQGKCRSCFTKGLACKQSDECCEPLVCGGGLCRECRRLDEPCSATLPCCRGTTCQQGKCDWCLNRWEKCSNSYYKCCPGYYCDKDLDICMEETDGGVPDQGPNDAVPDQGPPGTYGSICDIRTKNCAAGLTCVQTYMGHNHSYKKGFCTKTCQYIWSEIGCSGGPPGTKGMCMLYDSKLKVYHCAFLCERAGSKYPCPPGVEYICMAAPSKGTRYCSVSGPKNTDGGPDTAAIDASPTDGAKDGTKEAGKDMIAACGKLVFVSSAAYKGKFGSSLTGSLALADATCQSLATAAKLGGTWKAWLSSSTDWPAKRFVQSSKKYCLLDGTLVANNFTDLVDGSLAHAIDMTEKKTTVSAEVWTGTDKSGKNAPNTCNSWTSQSTTYWGNTGRTTDAGAKWTHDSGGVSAQKCDQALRIYCFEQ